MHDPAGNLLGSPDEVNGQNRSGQVTGNRLNFQGDRHYSYDDQGNRVEERRGKDGRQTTRYRYDHQNRLTGVAKTIGDTMRITEYQYDALGRRIRKVNKDESGNVTGGTEFYWNDDVLLSEQSADISAEQQGNGKVYVFEPGTFKPLAFVQGGEINHYHLDHLGTPQEITNADGELVWTAQYKAYGSLVLAAVRQVENNLRFQGQYYDEESGLHYNRHRYYDPECGRFINQDPIGLLGGDNNYRYVPNPTGWTDPLGLSCKENSWNVFQKRSKGVFADSSQAADGYKLWKQQDWAALEALLPPNSWPPNRGAIKSNPDTIPAGKKIDRYGGWNDASGFHDTGTFVSPVGEPFPARALPASTLNKPYKSYEVLKPIDVEAAEAIPWFGQPGMGTQYELPAGIDDLVTSGYLRPI